MNKTTKHLCALVMVSLVYGILPVIIFSTGAKEQIATHWPFWFSESSMSEYVKILLIPIAFIVYSHIFNRKAYHGLWAAALCLGFIVKHMDASLSTHIILLVMMLLGAVNAYAYSRYTNESISDWLSYKYNSVNKSKASNTNNSDLADNILSKPAITFKDVVGMGELKDKLLKAGNEIKAKNGKRNGILLVGEPGNGKTTLARALAGSLGLKMLETDFGQMASKWVNETTEKVMKVFDDAEKNAPCVLFIDEIDAVLIDRNKVSKHDGEEAKTVSALLKRLESIRGKGVVLVAASNYLDRLDPAAIREGRFDYKIEITPPDFEARVYLVKTGLKSIPAKDVDVDSIARVAKRWEGYSAARIISITTEVTEQYNDKKITLVGFDEMIGALRSIQSSKGNKLSESALSINELILQDESKRDLSKLLKRMQNIELVEEMGGTVPNGCLFYGPPGTGKTVVAQALAKDSGWSFLPTSGHDLLRNPQNIDDLIKKAKDIRPCIVFIDEADDVLADRQSAVLSKDVTNKLLTVMDGSGGKINDLMFIAATNHPDTIDDAMLRGGRFTEKFEFTLPGTNEIAEYVNKWMLKTNAKLGNSFILDDVVSLLEGQALSNINEILKLAVNESIDFELGNTSKVEYAHLEKAFRTVNGN